jgi:hypothetical protein
MKTKEIITIKYIDNDFQDNGYIIVRRSSVRVLICVGLEQNGDIETSLSIEDTKKLLEALQQAINPVLPEN